MEKHNPNGIGELLGLSSGVETSPESVYRSLVSDESISDIYKSGIVRSKAAAGIPGRYGDTVYWSKGEEGKKHFVQEGGYVIEAPHDIAKERPIEHSELTAIYTKREGNILDLLKDHEDEERQKKIEELRRELGIIK